MNAVDHAHAVLGWHEHRDAKNIPPRWMWHVDHELAAFFERVDEKRDESAPSGRRDEEAPMMRNALTAGLRR